MNKNYHYFLNYLNTNTKNNEQTILDFGCGVGKLVKILNEAGLTTLGIDINHTNNSDKYLNNSLIQEKKIQIISPNSRLPFGDQYFDFIISNMVFEHVFNIELAMSEIYRVLKNDGVVYLRFPSYEVMREGHTGIPFTHKIKNKKILKIYMNIAFFLGLGVNRKKHGTREEWINHMVDYLENKTIYRKYNDLLKIFTDFHITQKEVSFLEYYFRNSKFFKFLLSTPIRHLLIYIYKKYVTLDFELRKKI